LVAFYANSRIFRRDNQSVIPALPACTARADGRIQGKYQLPALRTAW